MANPDDFLYEYAVVRYVPRVDREEFINIGMVMMCKRRRWLKGKIYIDADRVMAFDPRADIDFLSRQASLFMRNDVPSPGIPVEERYRWLTAVKSAMLQVSPSHPGLLPDTTEEDAGKNDAGDAESRLCAEFRRLFHQLVK